MGKKGREGERSQCPKKKETNLMTPLTPKYPSLLASYQDLLSQCDTRISVTHSPSLPAPASEFHMHAPKEPKKNGSSSYGRISRVANENLSERKIKILAQPFCYICTYVSYGYVQVQPTFSRLHSPQSHSLHWVPKQRFFPPAAFHICMYVC